MEQVSLEYHRLSSENKSSVSAWPTPSSPWPTPSPVPALTFSSDNLLLFVLFPSWKRVTHPGFPWSSWPLILLFCLINTFVFCCLFVLPLTPECLFLGSLLTILPSELLPHAPSLRFSIVLCLLPEETWNGTRALTPIYAASHSISLWHQEHWPPGSPGSPVPLCAFACARLLCLSVCQVCRYPSCLWNPFLTTPDHLCSPQSVYSFCYLIIKPFCHSQWPISVSAAKKFLKSKGYFVKEDNR